MSTHDDGGPAFPVGQFRTMQRVGEEPRDIPTGPQGMTLRDWFAGQEVIDDEEWEWAVCEWLAGPRPTGNCETNPGDWVRWNAKWRAELKLMRADAIIAARKAKP